MALTQQQYDSIKAQFQNETLAVEQAAQSLRLFIGRLLDRIDPEQQDTPQTWTLAQIKAHAKDAFNAKRQAIIDAATAITVIT
ncbi:MAG: hypothetical protein ACKV2Q_36545 [Planctomycetaceae bacterium]